MIGYLLCVMNVKCLVMGVVLAQREELQNPYRLICISIWRTKVRGMDLLKLLTKNKLISNTQLSKKGNGDFVNTSKPVSMPKIPTYERKYVEKSQGASNNNVKPNEAKINPLNSGKQMNVTTKKASVVSPNKYSVLENCEEEELDEMRGMSNRDKVDFFIRMKRYPTDEETQGWNEDMFGYLKQRWRLFVNVDASASYPEEVHEQVNRMAEEEVICNEEGIARQMNVEDVKGMDKNVLQDC